MIDEQHFSNLQNECINAVLFEHGTQIRNFLLRTALGKTNQAEKSKVHEYNPRFLWNRRIILWAGCQYKYML